MSYAVGWSVTRITREGQAILLNSSTAATRGDGAASGHSLREQVADGIKQLIIRERLRPGDLLPTESVLCEELRASRSSVREAVKMLAALDIVEVKHGHGTYVGRMSLAALVESLVFRGLLSREDDHRVIAELVEVRATLEAGLADRIVAGLDDAQRAELTRLADGMRRHAAAGEEFIELDRAFHLALMAPLANDLVLQLADAFWDVHAIVAPGLDSTEDQLALTADMHGRIAEAASAGDADALREAITAHYEPIRRAIERSRARVED